MIVPRAGRALRGARGLRRALRVLAAATAVGALLAGCAGLPRSGPPRTGQATIAPENISVIYSPSGPTKGDTAAQIVQGFLNASTSAQQNYAIAREFLSPDFEQKWDPSSQVLIEAAAPLVPDGTSSIGVSLTTLGKVDATGVYTATPSTATTELTFEVAKTKGQWRITHAPDGVVIADLATFEQVFSEATLNFFDPTFTYLVPDTRWFADNDALATRIASALLAGPSPWLAKGAVATAFPQGSALTADTVPVVDGTAQVDLNATAINAEPSTQKLMRLQLERSLESDPDVAGVSISVQHNALNVAAGSARSYPLVSAFPLVATSGAVGYLAGASVRRIEPLGVAIAKLTPTAFTISDGATTAAVRNAHGVSVIRPGADAVLVDGRRDLIAPTIDPDGSVWTVSRSDPTRIRITAKDGTRTTITAPWKSATSISALQISRDGTRVLALTSRGSESTLVVVGVLRGSQNEPVRLGVPLVLDRQSATPVDAAWLDADSVGEVTTVSASGDNRITTVSIGGPDTVALGSTSKIVAIAGGNTTDQVRLLTANGELLQQSGSIWTSMSAATSKISALGTIG